MGQWISSRVRCRSAGPMKSDGIDGIGIGIEVGIEVDEI